MPHYPNPFRIARPATLAEASELLLAGAGDAALYAGGTELLLAMKQAGLRYAVLIDLKAIPGLDGITDHDDGVEIGALATHRSIARSPIVRAAFAELARLEGSIANPRVRSTGTLGGNVCFAEPHSDPATLLLALDATMHVVGPQGDRSLDVAPFTAGPYEAALDPGEVLR
ncbi:MAG: xanthine dehydrogenase family protein subunit M, partial [Chloroflexota bacterium]